MIRLVTGTPGSGKTLYCQHLLIEELLWTERTIVTNIPIQRKELSEYLESQLKKRSKWEDRIIDLDERLVEIDIEQSFEFFRYRSDGLILPSPPDNDKSGKRLGKREFETKFNSYIRGVNETEKTRRPVTYILSEAHRFFATADWSSVGRTAQAYLTHHRHLHDEVIFDTQHYEQLAKQLRLLIAECWVMQNQYNERFGPFRKRPCFKRKGYYVRPNQGNSFSVETMYLDAGGVASTYRSTGALGEVGSRGPEERRKPKGLPWWSLYVGAGGFVVLCWFLISMIPNIVGAGIGGIISGIGSGLEDSMGLPDAAEMAPRQTANQGETVALSGIFGPSGVVAPAPKVETRGVLKSFSYVQMGVRQIVRAVTLDGVVITQESSGFEGVNPSAKAVRFNGVEYHFQRQDDDDADKGET